MVAAFLTSDAEARLDLTRSSSGYLIFCALSEAFDCLMVDVLVGIFSGRMASDQAGINRVKRGKTSTAIKEMFSSQWRRLAELCRSSHKATNVRAKMPVVFKE